MPTLIAYNSPRATRDTVTVSEDIAEVVRDLNGGSDSEWVIFTETSGSKIALKPSSIVAVSEPRS